MNKLTEQDLDQHEAERMPARYKHTKPELAWRRADPVQQFGGADTVPVEYGADKLRLQGVEVHPMPQRPRPKPEREPLTWTQRLVLVGCFVAVAGWLTLLYALATRFA